MSGLHDFQLNERRCSSRFQFFVGLISGLCAGAAGAALYYLARRRFGRKPGSCDANPDRDSILKSLADISARLQALEKRIEDWSRTSRRPGSGYVTADSSLPSSDRDDKFEDVNESAGSGDEIFFHAVSTPSLRSKVKKGIISAPAEPPPPLSLPPPSSTASAPEDSAAFFVQVDQLLDGDSASKQEAYDMLSAKFLMHQDDAAFIWRLSRATFLLSQQRGSEGDAASKRELAFRARELAFQALQLDESDGDVHKWCALTIGNLGEYVTVAEKIRNGLTFKEHIAKAIELKPDDPMCHHLLGRWFYNVYMLTWVERKVASALVSEMPRATADQALDAFIQAERLKPNQWKENMLFVAKCFIEKRQYEDATSWLRSADVVPIVSADDQQAHEQVQTLLNTYSGY